jgi:aspartate aminotransferase
MNLKVNNLVENLEESATEIVDNAIKRMRREGITDIVSLGVGEPYFDTPAIIKEAAKKALDAGITKYQPTFGDYALREAIQKKIEQKNGIRKSVEDIMVTPGAKFAIYLAMQALLEPGDKVVVLDPSWVSHTSIPLMMGAELVRLPTIESIGYQPDLDAISDALKAGAKCIILNSPCNPTGAVYPENTLRDICNCAGKYGALVLSDEIYEDLVYEGTHYSPGADFENVFTINGFSKSFAMTGWRLGYATGPKPLLEEIIKIYQHSASCVTSFAQAGALEALTNPEAAEATQAMVNEFRNNRRIITEFLNDSSHFDCVSPNGAFYCFTKYDLPIKSLDLAQNLLAKSHVATVPGGAFGECGEYHLRLSYATHEDALRQGLDRLEEYFDHQGK